LRPRHLVYLLGGLLALPACGKRGDPLPPLPIAPQPVRELRVSQRGPELEISYAVPRLTTGGVRLPVLEVELSRAEGEGDFAKLARRDVRRVAPGEVLTERVPLPAPDTVVRVMARARHRGQFSTPTVVTFRAAAVPETPRALKAVVTPEGVGLTWEGAVPPAPPTPAPSPSPSPSAAPPSAVKGPPPAGASPAPGASPSPPPKPPARGFRIYRRSPSGTAGAPLRAEPGLENATVDRDVQPGQEWCYVVRSAASIEPVIESAPSPEVCVAVKDVAAPAAPAGLAALVGETAIDLSWSPSGEADLAAYRVYRAAGDQAPQRLAEVPAGTTEWKDKSPGRGGPHTYTVTAVDRAGNESAPSGPAEAHLP
jgi:hypothetical protein